MLQLKIDDRSIKKTARWLDSVGKKQLPFATALALTTTAKDVQRGEVKELHDKFTIRNKWPTRGPYAIKVLPAKKKKLTSIIYTNADWMPLHEFGGDKIPRGNHIAVPTSNVKRTKSGKISKANRPANLKRSFVLKQDNGQLGIWQRKGKGKRSEIRPMYWLENRARIKAVWDWFRTGKKIIDRRFSRNFMLAFNKAMKTAKK